MPASRTAHPLIDTGPEAQHLLAAFYTTARAGHLDRLAGGGGPLGFDITTACQLHVLLSMFGCDGIVESGCHLGDTTDYLSRAYPALPVRSCDLDPGRAAFTRRRLAGRSNAEVRCGDSALLLKDLMAGMERPLVFLDAHWSSVWPLRAELGVLEQRAAVVVVDDFDIGHPRFGFDSYEGVVCGPQLVAKALPHLERMFVADPEADYPFPCLQTGRRSGTGILLPNLDDTLLAGHPYFAEVPLRPLPVLPTWTSTPSAAAVRSCC
ncbi:hypothetical protein [Streptomyces sp. NBC_01304]|uniref:hypothetical protein n=1 Tax=Streptomyces sp. NBC_01304 TaxID=2903818 RepID=UPI002E14F245|nr:hypothetical protein OG430_41215 [Streptomyces sp. NBC_01304]